MQQMRVVILFVLIACAILYGALKAYIYFSVKSELDDAIVRAQPFADISYQGISSGLEGSISVDRIEVRTPEQVLPLRIGSLVVEGRDMGFLFDAASGFSSSKPQSRVRVSLLRLELPDLQRLVSTNLPAPSFKESLGSPAQTNPCGLAALLGKSAPFSSDRFPVVLDMRLGYELDLESAIGRIDFGYEIDDGESMTVDMSFTGIPSAGSLMLGGAPVIERIALSYSPVADKLKEQLTACAKEDGLSVDLYIENLVSQTDRQLYRELGFVPGSEIREAVKRFLLDPKEIQLSGGPVENVLQLGSGRMSPKELMDLLDITMSVNGKPLENLAFETPAKGDSSPRGNIARDATKTDDQGRIKALMIETPTAELDGYLNREARFFVRKRNEPHTGVLVSIHDSVVSVEKRLMQGKMTLHIPVEDIIRADVMRFPDVTE